MDTKKRDPERTIESALEFETGNEIIASEFFKQPEATIWAIRRQFEDTMQKNGRTKYVCSICKQNIKIGGGGPDKRILHFSHFKDSDDCPIKTDTKYTKEEIERINYNKTKESLLHIELKNFIKDRLEQNKESNKGVTNVKSEEIYKDKAISKEWKRPDVQAEYKGLNLVIELQLSTTFLSVIVKRENFYKERKTYILWIFHQFDTNSDLQKFTQKDVIYANKQNAFVLDETAQAKSLAAGDLVLLCYYREPSLDNGVISIQWQKKYVTLGDLKFDEKEYKVYFIDTDQEVASLGLKKQREAQQRRDQSEARIQNVRNLFNTFFKTDACPRNLSYELSRLSTHESKRLYEIIKNGRIRLQTVPFIHYLMENDKHSHLLAFLLRQDHFYESIQLELPDVGWKVMTSKLSGEELEFAQNSRSVLIAIMSVKIGRIYSSKLANWNAYANHILQSKREFSKLYITSLKRYDKYREILAHDKNGAFRKKIADVEQSNPEQNKDHDHFFKKIFPELFEQGG